MIQSQSTIIQDYVMKMIKILKKKLGFLNNFLILIVLMILTKCFYKKVVVIHLQQYIRISNWKSINALIK